MESKWNMNSIDKWLHIIRNCSFDITYKMAWGKAITEIAVEYEELAKVETSLIEVQLREIAKRVLRYYFEQTTQLALKSNLKGSCICT